jgi:oligopeptide transport system permease protein
LLLYILKRFVQSVLTLLVITTTVFLLLRLMPEEGYFGENYDKLDEVQKEAILTQMGLRDPLHIQLYKFYKNLLHGDLGRSIVFRPRARISRILKPKIPYSLYFGLAAEGLALLIGIPMGLFMTRYKGKFFDSFGTCYIVLINSIPAAVYYLFIQLYASAAFKLPMLFDEGNPASWVLPAVSLSLGGIAYYAMWMRRYMVDELNRDYVKLARAKGLSNTRIMWRHVMRNAFVPITQYIPMSILLTISGSIYVESLFSIPGMGGLLVTAIQRQDNTLVQALVLIFSSIGILGLFLGDVLMAICDPRIKLTRKAASR